ncbi:MAG: glycosyltransferase [Rikenellaceae bacterium]
MIRVSLYVRSGNSAAVTFYRFYQYLTQIDSVEVSYHTMIPEQIYRRYMPISGSSVAVRIFVVLLSQFRVSLSLLRDFVVPPSVLIISRKLTDRFSPIYYFWILRSLRRRGVKIIWDFDDNIIDSREISRSNFDRLSELSHTIVVASPHLYTLIQSRYLTKTIYLPTTDGTLYGQHNSSVDYLREQSLDKELRIIWVGTSVSLAYLEPLAQMLEVLAQRSVARGRRVTFTVVCNHPLLYRARGYTLRNVVWTREVAATELLNAHIGVMPLENSEFNRGKGGFKLIQYLSVGLPVVVSAVGINRDIVTRGEGYCINRLDSTRWIDALEEITSTPSRWREYSRSAKATWLERFSFERGVERWRRLILECS